MALVLDPFEARVLGVLIEKEATTPDQYPLSLAALVAGCNQKSNREPVTLFSEPEVRLTLDGLRVKGLAGASHASGGRVERYRHGAREVLDVGPAELAVLAELLMRGPQSRGELRVRASRMRPIDSLEELAETLAKLAQRGFVAELPPAPGGRSARIAQLLAPDAHPEGAQAGGGAPRAATPSAAPAPPRTSAAPAPAGPQGLDARVASLEADVRRLTRQLAELAGKLGEELAS